MRYKYCPECGEKAVLREIGDEGLIPYCEKCQRPWFDIFPTCVICAAVNEFGEVALIKQGYVTDANYICVAGYMKSGEAAEDAAAREVEEEIGLEATSVEYIRSYPYAKKDMLMLGFKVNVKKAELKLSCEVDSARWFSLDEARDFMREGSIAWQLVGEVAKGVNK